VVLTRNSSVNRAIDAIPDDAWVPVRYPGAVKDPDTGELISDAEVADVAYTAFDGTPQAVTARLIVRRVRDRNTGPEDEMFPVWRYHPFFTNGTEPRPGRGHHPPPTRHHRDAVRRSDRRALGALSRDTQIGPLSINPARSVILSVWLAQDHDR
jgi:hypothetical protein